MKFSIIAILLLPLIVMGCQSIKLPNLDSVDMDQLAATPNPNAYVIAQTGIDGNVQVSPVTIYIDGVKSGSIVDTFLTDEKDNTPKFWWHKAGDNISIKIKNGKPKPTVFQLTYVLPQESIMGYAPAPMIVKDWVTIAANEVYANSGEVVSIPVKLAIPGHISQEALNTFPKKWMFRIQVDDLAQSKQQVQTNVWVSWLVSMK